MLISNTKLINIIHQDFTNFDVLENLFKKNDALIWCLGRLMTKYAYEV